MLKQMELKFWPSFAPRMGDNIVEESQRCKQFSGKQKGLQGFCLVWFVCLFVFSPTWEGYHHLESYQYRWGRSFLQL